MLLNGNFEITPVKPMANSDAKGVAVLHDGQTFGADVIEFPSFGQVQRHTHAGQHMLFVLSGSGVVIRNDCSTELKQGSAYLVGSQVPHSVYAGADGLKLLVVGDKHQPVDSIERMDLC